MAQPQPHRLFAPCAPGLEPWLLQEVRCVGGVRPKAVAGGIEFEANQHVLLRSLLELGLALDVRIRLGAFPAPNFDAVVKRTAELPWGDYIGAGQSVEVRATAKRSKLFHTGAIEERVLGGIREVVGSLASDDADEPWRVYARMNEGQLSISLSAAGAPLHRRGYRKAVGKAPLREDLARALLRVTQWSPEVPLVDPFCGSGTIVIEAARLALNIPPGWDRQFHFLRSPTLDQERWQRIRNRLSDEILGASPPIYASDRDEGVIEMAKSNAERAGVYDAIQFQGQPLGRAQFPEADVGFVATNPPFGGRIQGGDGLKNLYVALAQRVAALGSGWTLGMLTEQSPWVFAMGLDLESLLLTDHGGKKVRFYRTLQAKP